MLARIALASLLSLGIPACTTSQKESALDVTPSNLYKNVKKREYKTETTFYRAPDGKEYTRKRQYTEVIEMDYTWTRVEGREVENERISWSPTPPPSILENGDDPEHLPGLQPVSREIITRNSRNPFVDKYRDENYTYRNGEFEKTSERTYDLPPFWRSTEEAVKPEPGVQTVDNVVDTIQETSSEVVESSTETLVALDNIQQTREEIPDDNNLPAEEAAPIDEKPPIDCVVMDYLPECYQ